MVHIAGLGIRVAGRHVRQLCAWCGEPLIDYDELRIIETGGERPVMWPEGRMIRTDGDCWVVLPQGRMPEDACSMLEVHRPGMVSRQPW